MAYPEGYPMIHPTLQDRDFELLNEGDPVFMDLDGGCKLFQREFRELSDAFGLDALVALLCLLAFLLAALDWKPRCARRRSSLGLAS